MLKKRHGLLAFVLIALQWIGPVVLLCLMPWKVLAVLGAIALVTWGVLPIIGLGVWFFFSILILEACGFDL